MADFTALKTAIQQYIAQNGNKEITGNLLQTILLAMVQSMGDQAINGVLQMLSNEMTAREHADGLLSQALTTEQQRAIAAETKSVVLDGETKTLVFKNAAGQELYQVSVASLVSNGLVDVEVDGTNLVMTFHTESGEKEITIPISDIFNPSNYYTKTQVDSLLLPLSRAITRINDTLHEGALYAGYATPETIPTEHEGASLFYIATEAGEYIHFFSNGDIPVVIQTPGIHLIVGGIEADDWNYETIVTFTNNVQFNNAQLITSGGVFNAILPINELLHRNYMLAGVAYTTTIPTEDTNVFYLAGQGGTYTHFLNGNEDPLVLSKGLTVIYRGVEDDGWNYWVVYADNDFINTNRAQALTSNQQTEAQNNLEGKLYEPAQFSGLGKKMLAKNIQQVGGVSKNVMTQAFFEDEQGNALTNTVFVIQYDYTLGENVTIPAGCMLQFDGGSISGNGNDANTISGRNTKIEAGPVKIFNSTLTLGGTWTVDNWNICWFGCVGDGVFDNSTAFSYALSQMKNIGTKVIDGYAWGDYCLYVPDGKFLFHNTVVCDDRLNLVGTGSGSVIKCDFGGILFNLTGRNTFDLRGINFMGTDPATSGSVAIYKHGEHIPLGNISNCNFVSFDTAVDLERPYWTRIISCNFSGNITCDIKGKNANDFSVISCNLRGTTTVNHLYFTGDNQGVCVTGCDFSGGTEASILFNSAYTNGFTITGNYFEPGVSGEYAFGPVVEIRNGSTHNFVFEGNAVYERGMNDPSIAKEPRYFVILDNANINTSRIIGHVIIKTRIRGFGCTAVCTLNAYTDFDDNGVNLIDSYISHIRELISLDPSSQQYQSVYAEIGPIINGISQIIANKQKTTDNIKNDIMTVSVPFPQIIHMYTSRVFTMIGTNGGSSRWAPTDLPIGHTYYENEPKKLCVFNGTKYTDCNGFTPILSSSSTSYRNEVITGGTKVLDIADVGLPFYDRTTKTPLFLGSKVVNGESVVIWREYDTAVAGVKRSGTFTQKPLAEDIYVGFAYFCTDKQTTEGATDGIMIYHKGGDVWVDALGRAII